MRLRPFNSVTGSELTLGAVSKLAAAADENRAALAKLTAELDAKPSKIEKLLDERDARISQALEKIKAEDAKREASRANVLAWIRAQPDPAQFEVLARNNGISPSELRR
jgi:hypothetical protein